MMGSRELEAKDKDFVAECVALTNKYRILHQVEPLKYNYDIERIARQWAENLAKTNSMMHNPNSVFHGRELGENIASRYSSAGDPITGAQTIDQWYNEVDLYDFKTSSGRKTGHFTQLVWKDSKEFGISRAQRKDGTWIVVANYYPAGNFEGEFAQNVLPSKNMAAKSARVGTAHVGTAHVGTARAGTAPVATGPVRQVNTETVGNTTKTTETVTYPDGASTTIVTVRTTGPGQFTKLRVTETSKKADGSTSTRTSETTEHSRTDAHGKPISGQLAQVQQAYRLTPSKISDDLREFCRDVVSSHNSLRKRHHNTGPLVLNDDLVAMAQDWALHLAKNKSLLHSGSSYRGQTVGENIASKHGTSFVDYKGQEVVELWYKEIDKYDYRNPPDQLAGMQFGHFTQVIWKDSTDIGVGKAISDDNRVFVVAHYYPAGNYVGRKQYENNVFPLK